MISQAICIAPTGDRCGEGVLWHEAHAAVYWTDINRFLIHRLNVADQTVRSWFFDEPVTALAPTDRDDVLAVCLGSRVILWEPSSNRQLKEFFRLGCWPRVRFNDGRADPCGSLWVGSMRNNVAPDGSSTEVGGKDGVLYRLDLRLEESATGSHSWRTFLGDLRMVRQSMRKVISGTVVSVADASCVWRQTEQSIASSRCRKKYYKLHLRWPRPADSLRHNRGRREAQRAFGGRSFCPANRESGPARKPVLCI